MTPDCEHHACDCFVAEYERLREVVHAYFDAATANPRRDEDWKALETHAREMQRIVGWEVKS